MRASALALLCLLSVPSTGCLRRFVAQEARYLVASRYVFQQPVEEVWPAVREVLKEEGFKPQESAGSYEIVTDWNTENAGSLIVGTHSRYMVLAERVGADRCIIRFVRLSTLMEGTEAYQAAGPKAFTRMQLAGRKEIRQGGWTSQGNSGGLMTRRDLKMEWKVLARVRPDIAALTEAEIERRLPAWLGEDPESTRLGPAAKKLPATAKVAAKAPGVTAQAASPGLATATVPETATVSETATGTMTTHPTTAEAAAPAAPGECAPALYGEDAVRVSGKLVLLGETPGTAEIPLFVGQLACRAAHQGLEVVVGLEIPFDEQPRLDRYLSSGGSRADRDALLSGGFWRRAWQDGRSSEAVQHLLEQLRVLKREGHRVSALAFDVRGLGGNRRQQQMASRIFQARKTNPGALMLVLTGNVQARIVSGTSWDAELVPMGARLLTAEPKLLSLDAHYSGGDAWTCRLNAESQTECAQGFLPAPQRTRILGRGMASNKEADELHRQLTYVRLDQEAAGGAHHGVFYLGKMHASPPAVSDQRAWTQVR